MWLSLCGRKLMMMCSDRKVEGQSPELGEANSGVRSRRSLLQRSALEVLDAVAGCAEEHPRDAGFFGCLCAAVAELVGARRCAFWHIADGRLTLQPGTYGFESGRVGPILCDLQQPVGRLLQRVANHDADPLAKASRAERESHRELLRGLGAEHAIWAAWRMQSRVLGVLGAFDADHAFTWRDVGRLRLAARAAALAADSRQSELEIAHGMGLLEELADYRHQLLRRLLADTEEERRRVGRDIHDDSLQALTAVQLRLERLRSVLTDPRRRQMVDDASVLVERADRSLRALLVGLRPPALDLPGGLESAVREYLERLQATGELHCDLNVRLLKHPSVEASQLIYRVLQDAILNVEKHARASTVEVLLREHDRGVLCRVSDDGQGFDVSDDSVSPGHVGLASMQERARLAGGWCRVESARGAGTRVEFWIPSDVYAT